MAWTAPRTWTTGELVTAALLNTHIRDNQLFMGGTDGDTPGAVMYGVFEVKDKDDVLATGNDQFRFTVPKHLDGTNLVDVDFAVYTASSSGLPMIQIHNLTDTSDMLSTRATIDANETDSTTATTPPVIDTGNDGVSEGDVIRVDVDTAGTGTKGLSVRLGFKLP